MEKTVFFKTKYEKDDLPGLQFDMVSAMIFAENAGDRLLTCNRCGSGLQMNSGDQSTVCTPCRLVYPMERLQEKLGMQYAQKQEPFVPRR